jgi:phosphoglycolate phosphatase
MPLGSALCPWRSNHHRGAANVAIRGILFDKDGTLIDYAQTWVPINRRAAAFAAGGDAALAADLLRLNGQDPETGDITPGSVLAAGSIAEIAAAFAARLGPRTPPDLEGDLDRTYSAGGGEFAALIEGVADTLRELKRQGIRIGVATNDSLGGLDASLRRCGILDLFDFVAACDSGFGSKPDPRMVFAFCEAVGVAIQETAVVGDALHDLAMGRAAGAGLIVGVTCGTSAREDLLPYADIILDRIDGLLALPALSAKTAAP